MSYLSNNPFSRPTPNFSANINTFNTYSTNDYVSMANKGYGSSANYSSSYGFGTGPSQGSTGGYFGAGTKAESAQYKYTRTVESNPFSTGANPFSTSSANLFSASNVSNYNEKPSNAYETSNNRYSRPSYSSYGSSYENNQNISTSATKRQFSYEPKLSTVSGFADPYQQNCFKKDQYGDNFRRSNFQTEFKIELGKSRENQIDQKYKIGTKQTQISKMLQQNPFNRGSISSQANKYDPTPIENPYTSSNKKYDQYDYKNPHLATSNVKPIYGVDNSYDYLPPSSTNIDSFKKDHLQHNTKSYQADTYDFHNDNVSQRDSNNTLINKFNDIVSDKTQSKENQQRNHENNKDPQLDNPFIRNSNPFLKSQKPSVNSPKVQPIISKPYEQQFKISESSGKSSDISLGDFQDLQKKKSSAESVQQKYDKYIFRRSSDGSKKSNYDQKVKEKFDFWQKQSKKSDKYYDAQNIDKEFEFNDYSKKSQKSLPHEKNLNKVQDSFGQNKESIKSLPMKQYLTQRTQMKESSGNKNVFSFMKQSTQKSAKDQFGVQVQKNKKSLTEYDFNPSKNSKNFKFSGQNFEDESEHGQNELESSFQRNRRQIQQGLKRISEVSLSQQRETQKNFSKKQSKASLTQKNTEQKIDEKLQKFRYNYDKPIIQQPQSPKLNDFLDMNADEDQQENYSEQSSFQQISPTRDQAETLQNSKKRINLKEKMISSSKKLIFTEQQISQEFNSVEQNPLDRIHRRLENKIELLKKETQIPKKNSPQRYEFQSLEQFEQKYQYNMRESGFNFDEDSFQQIQIKLGIQVQNHVTSKDSFNKVLSPEFGYHEAQEQKTNITETFKRQTLQDQSKKQVKPAKSYISSVSSNSQRLSMNKKEQDQDFVPTFNMKDSLNGKKYPQSEIREGSSHRPLVSEDALPIMQSLRQSQKRKQSIQPKVHKVKIYESEDESNRNSGQYETYIFGKTDINQEFRTKSIKLIVKNQNKEENNYKSPFEKKIDSNSQKRTSKISDYKTPQKEPSRKQMNRYDEKNSKNLNTKWGSQNMLYGRDAYKMDRQQNEEDIEFSEQDLKETKKQVGFGSNSQDYKEQLVRDSFDFNGYQKPKQKFGLRQEKVQKPRRRQYPLTLEVKSNIYYLIEFVEN